MYGDISYAWVTSGSTAASADTVHNLFGTYQGLSQLNANEVVHIQLKAVTNAFRIGPVAQLTNNSGFQVSTTLWEDLPPIKASNAVKFGLINDGAGSNASAMFVIWRRV